ncbi:hypothetical protein Tco_1025917 [Tanacetum coccineum]
MHTRASNYELVEPLFEHERTLNLRLRRRNRRVPFERRDEPPEHPRVIYPPILDITLFCHILKIIENHNPKDDEPKRAADRVVASTPSPAITILETVNEFTIKGDAKTWLDELNEGTIDSWDELRTTKCSRTAMDTGNIIKKIYHGLNETTQEALNAASGDIFLYKTPNQAYQLLEDKVLLKLDWAKGQKLKSYLNKTVAFADEGSSNSDTKKIMARMDAMTMKMDAQYKKSNLVPNAVIAKVITQPQIVMMTHPCLVKTKQNSGKPSDIHVFTMITVIETQIAIIDVQVEETITIETIIDPTLMKNQTSKNN